MADAMLSEASLVFSATKLADFLGVYIAFLSKS